MDGRKRDHHMNVNENKKTYVTIDIAKFVMAILVVAIHVRPFSGEAAFVYDDIVARIADPLFFQITAFLFLKKSFGKIRICGCRNPVGIKGRCPGRS